MRYSRGCVAILLVTCSTAAASVPSVDQLLDRFAANADRHSASFLMKLESDREVIIERMEHDLFKPGKRQEHYSIDCRWDGQRARLREHSRLGSGTTKIDFGEIVVYRSILADLSKRMAYYHDESQPGEDAVEYLDASLPKEACFNDITVNAANWVWGYFADEDSARIDGFLRWLPTAKVRPQTERVGTSDCYVLEAETRKARYTIWFDPTHGGNFAKLHYEKPGTKIVVANRSFRRCGEAWVPMEMEWEVLLRQPESDARYRQKTIVTAFEVNPDHPRLQSFVLDDIPEGTRVDFVSGKGYRMPGTFAWRAGKPVPCVDKNTLAQLNRAADSILARAMRVPAVDTGKHSLDVVGASGVSSAPYCGLYCLYLMMKVYGRDPNLGALVTPDYLDTPKGSTLSAIKRAVEDADLHAEILLRANTRVLRSCSSPVILHVRGGEASRDYDHYVLFLGTEGPWARLCEPPGGVRLASLDELSSRWDGNGVIVANKPVELAGVVRQERIRLFLVAGSVILTLFLTGRIRRHLVWPDAFSSVIGKSAVSVVQFGGLGVASLIVGLAFQAGSMGGFLRYPEGVASTQRAHAADFIPRIGLNAAKRLSREGSIFVDARGKRDFEGGHVDGAISVPVDANDIARRGVMKAVPLGGSVVVYCQSEACQFADIIAGKLRVDGFSNVCILRGGWIEWSTGGRIRVRKSDQDSGKWRLNSDGTATPL